MVRPSADHPELDRSRPLGGRATTRTTGTAVVCSIHTVAGWSVVRSRVVVAPRADMDTGTIAEAITKAVARDGPDPNENMRLAFEL